MSTAGILWCVLACNAITITFALAASKAGRKFIKSLYLYYKNKEKFPKRYDINASCNNSHTCFNCKWMVKSKIDNTPMYCVQNYFFEKNNGLSCKSFIQK